MSLQFVVSLLATITWAVLVLALIAYAIRLQKARKLRRRIGDVRPCIVMDHTMQPGIGQTTVTMEDDGRLYTYPVELRGHWVDDWHVVHAVQGMAMDILPGTFRYVQLSGRNYAVTPGSLIRV